MILHDRIQQALVERLSEFRAPKHGKVKIEMELNFKGALADFRIDARPIEVVKVG